MHAKEYPESVVQVLMFINHIFYQAKDMTCFTYTKSSWIHINTEEMSKKNL